MVRIIIIFIAVFSILLLGIYYLDQNQTNPVLRASIPVTEAISYGDTAGFKRALKIRDFSFPEDPSPF